MRRLVVLGALALVAVAAAGCGGGGGGGSSGNYDIALVTGDNHDPFYVTMNQGAQDAASKLGAKVTWQGPATFEPQPQISILDSVFSSKPDFLLVAPTDVKALIQPIGRFDQANVPVMTVDTDVDDHSVRLGNITSDNAAGGQLAANYFKKNLPKGSQVAYVGEQRGVFTTDQRFEGYEKGLKGTGLDYVGPQFGADDPATATSITNALLQRYPDLKGIFASDTAYGQGAATAVQNAGKAGKVKIVAFDAEPEEVSALQRGLIQALVVQKAYDMGYRAVQDAVNYLKDGTKPPKEYNPSYVIATPKNYKSPSVSKYIYKSK